MLEFEWFRFDRLSLEDFARVVDVNPDHVEHFYGKWDRDYQRSLVLFLRYQQGCLRRAEFKNFAESLNLRAIDEHEFFYDYPEYVPEWKEWQECSRSLQEHSEMLDYEIGRNGRSGRIVSGADFFAEFDFDLQNGWTVDQVERVKEFWFNLNVKPLASIEVARYRRAYPEYLKTSHWRRVRAAMLLINNAHCGDCDKDGCSESYYGGGWESELHVHHRTYKNFGREQYQDLDLLCQRHHSIRHSLEA